MKLLALQAVYCFGFNLYHAFPNLLDQLDYHQRVKVSLALAEIREMTSAYRAADCSIKLIPSFFQGSK